MVRFLLLLITITNITYPQDAKAVLLQMVHNDRSRSHRLSPDIRDRIHSHPLHSASEVLVHRTHRFTNIRLLDVHSHDEEGWNQAPETILLRLVLI